jgi:hypothetical protein
MQNYITPSLAFLKVGLRTKQKSRRLVGWRKVMYKSVRYSTGIAMLYLFVKLFIYLAF